jgi:hypothetical protein
MWLFYYRWLFAMFGKTSQAGKGSMRMLHKRVVGGEQVHQQHLTDAAP